MEFVKTMKSIVSELIWRAAMSVPALRSAIQELERLRREVDALREQIARVTAAPGPTLEVTPGIPLGRALPPERTAATEHGKEPEAAPAPAAKEAVAEPAVAVGAPPAAARPQAPAKTRSERPAAAAPTAPAKATAAVKGKAAAARKAAPAAGKDSAKTVPPGAGRRGQGNSPDPRH